MKRSVLGIVNGIFLEEIIFFITYVHIVCSDELVCFLENSDLENSELRPQTQKLRGTQREFSSKPLKLKQ